MKKHFRTTHNPWFTKSILFSLMLVVACQKTPDPPLELGQSLMSLGTYQVSGESEGQVPAYEIGVHWYKNPDHRYYKFCNFYDKRIDVVFILHDGNHIRIPPQIFQDGFETFEIFEGTGELTDDGFEIIFWAMDNNINVTKQITARSSK